MKTKTHQEMVDLTINILEKVENGQISEAKKQIEKLTAIEMLKVIALGEIHYCKELKTIYRLAEYNW